MSDTPQKPPFEETEAYKSELMQYAFACHGIHAFIIEQQRHIPVAVRDLPRYHTDALATYQARILDLRQRYERDEL